MEYHVEYIPPKVTGRCDRDGTMLRQREDDAPKKVRERFRAFREVTQPLVDYYQGRGLLARVDAVQKPAIVYSGVKAMVQKL